MFALSGTLNSYSTLREKFYCSQQCICEKRGWIHNLRIQSFFVTKIFFVFQKLTKFEKRKKFLLFAVIVENLGDFCPLFANTHSLAAIFAQKYFILLENCNKLKRKKYLDYERRRMIRWSNFQRDFAESYTFKAKNRLKFA